jgi:hypothetical protein
MIHKLWQLSEAGPYNLGLACTDDGLVLGRTPLIERCGGRFVVRERAAIEKLLKHVRPNVDGLMPRLAAVASALNANDPCLARIAAVHLKIPDLPDLAARGEIEFEDALIRSSDWNPDLHPRTGTPPNPGWFAPTGSSDHESSPVQTAQNDGAALQSDASEGGVLSGTSVDSSDIVGRALNLVVPKGSMTAAQARAIEAARARAINTNNYPVNLIITAF